MQLGKKFKRGGDVAELPEYARATHLLASLGLQQYQPNLKRGLLTDSTLHLWNERCAASPRAGSCLHPVIFRACCATSYFQGVPDALQAYHVGSNL